jgi:hypothetical protein
LDLVVRTRVLVAELVAGEPQNGEGIGVFGLDGLVELLETLELRGEAAFGGGVDDENDLALELVEGVWVALLCGNNRISLRVTWNQSTRGERERILSSGLKSYNLVAEAIVLE